MIDFLAQAAQTTPHHPALMTSHESISFRDLNLGVADLCARLEHMGLQRGQRVATLLDRKPASVILTFALARMRLSHVPLNSRLTVEEMRWQIAQANGVCTIDVAETRLKEALHLSDLPASSSSAHWEKRELALNHEFGVLFTSGTSGQPKAASLTWGNLHASARASAARLGTQPDDRWMLSLPLFHIGGLSVLFRSALYGTTIVLPDFPDDRFDTGHLCKRLADSRSTLVSLVPTMLYRMMNEENKAWARWLRLILLGGAAATPDLLHTARRQNLPVAASYGLTEAASQVATAEPQTVCQKPGTVGKPLDGIQIRVCDAEGKSVQTGHIGEIQVQGPVVMRGYLGHAPLSGWLSTGDLGYLDQDGDLWIVQRRSDLIISGGENVYPAEVESVLRQHPAIADACVVGLPDPEWGQYVAAALVLKPAETLDALSLERFCKQKIAGYKIPRLFRTLAELPQTGSGKVQRDKVIQILRSQESHEIHYENH